MTAILQTWSGNLMPGSFSPEDYIELHHNPFDTSEPEQNTKDHIQRLITEPNHMLNSPVTPTTDGQVFPVSPLESTDRHSYGLWLKAAEHMEVNSPPFHEQQHGSVTGEAPEPSASSSQAVEPETAVDDVDWRQFSPPSLLGKAPTVSSQILLDIVSASIANVKARAAEEHRQKTEDEERRVREEKAARDARRSQALYLPIIIREDHESNDTPAEPRPTTSQSSRNSNADDANTDASSAGNASIRESKKRRFALKRFFQRSSDKGESSASVDNAGNTRETLRRKLRAKLHNLDMDSSDLLAQQTIAIFGGFGGTSVLLPQEPDTVVECVSCLDEFPSKSMIRVPCHYYCSDCFVRLVSAAVQNEQQWPAKCCLNPIPFRTVLRIVPDDLKKKFQERSREWNIPVSERVYCHNTDCGVWIQPDYISPGIRQGRCENGHWTCTICRGPIHGNNDCPDDQDMRLTNTLAEEEGWKRCNRCHALVEHKEACQHMTCRCGYQFCYVCNEVWRTCSCTMEQLNELKDAVATRRQQREFREQEESEELRRILAQIEEFEREEALQAELERQEQERLEEERRQRELEERALQESIRRRVVEEKYRQLRQSLDELHELQQVMLETYQQANSEDLNKEAAESKERLATEQALERSRISERTRENLLKKEADFDEDFALRVSEEQKVEDEYHRQLLEYWNGHETAVEEIEAAMLPLRQRMDQGFRAWQEWKAQELAHYEKKLESKKTIQEELMYSAKQRLEDKLEDKMTQLTRQAIAEGRWLQEIILERERLLNEAEAEEAEGDADSLFTPEYAENGTAA